MHLITDNLQMIIALCKKFKAKTLHVFGSILTPRFNDNNDVDFSATFYHEEDPLQEGENRIQFYIALTELMGRRIDLVDEDSLRNNYFIEELNETKQLIYGQEIKKYLEDILLSIQEIEMFLEQRPRRFQVYMDDIMFKRAIERNIGIIGEAMTKALQFDPDIQITNAHNIKNTRNYIVHAYDSLEPHIIWNIVINDILKLKEEVINILDNE